MMKIMRLKRDKSTAGATTGLLYLDNGPTLHTLERPWIPTHPGGKPSESCVPAGRYKVRRHVRPDSGEEVIALENPGLGVYYLPGDRPQGVGRFLILCHSANWVNQIEGCIAPGIGATVTDNGPMVTQSREAIKQLMEWVGDDDIELIIEDAQ